MPLTSKIETEMPWSVYLFVWGFTAQSTQCGHVERGQFT